MLFSFWIAALLSATTICALDSQAVIAGNWVDTWTGMPQLTEFNNLPPPPFVCSKIFLYRVFPWLTKARPERHYYRLFQLNYPSDAPHVHWRPRDSHSLLQCVWPEQSPNNRRHSRASRWRSFRRKVRPFVLTNCAVLNAPVVRLSQALSRLSLSVGAPASSSRTGPLLCRTLSRSRFKPSRQLP
jgi:hypothetical protein